MKFIHYHRRAKFVLLACYFSLCILLVTACDESTTTSQVRAAATQAISAPAVHYTSTEHSNIAYGSLPTETLDLCQPQGTKGIRPGIVLLHGGEWTQGDKKDMASLCQYFAQHGYVVANVNYRLAQKSVASSQWPAQLVDAQLAVRWLRSEAQQINLDSQHICALGESSGGQLAAFLGNLKTIHDGDQAQAMADQSSAVNCVVEEFGPVDLTQTQTPSLTRNMLALFGGTTLQQNNSLYRDASPILFIDKNSAPTLIIQGDNDTVVQPAESSAYQQELQRNNVSALYITYKGGHNFSGLTNNQQAHIQQQELSYIEAQEHP